MVWFGLTPLMRKVEVVFRNSAENKRGHGSNSELVTEYIALYYLHDRQY